MQVTDNVVLAVVNNGWGGLGKQWVWWPRKTMGILAQANDGHDGTGD